ncbi:hypothetical protein PLESTB_001126800 [Pleodorina starrii]|uniref:Uncharacterized protein n=1 Tax=Pleodorina starrii TaxID=330485 RepID=A0A9W6BR90_9CHLO|nr:hypothetical protein PLESTM_001364400 [Pleodorina starrii]GLC56613.1 hypothetical protein PLESTB_001126800 [Pleodorina starrii]GLC76201.1 hypothetical protein PLESTF_001749000 [Pleodorina starrii]
MSRTAALQRLARLTIARGGSCRAAEHAAGRASQVGAWTQHCPGIWLTARREMGTGVADLPDKTLAKARKLALAVGALAGAFGSLVGVGGGVLISPIIANICKTIPQRVISGTSLAAVAATGSAAGYVYWSSGAVDLTSAGIISAAAIATVPLGARATHAVDCAALRRLLAYWLFAVAPLVPLKPVIQKNFAGKGDQQATTAAAAAAETVTSAPPAAGEAGGGASGAAAAAPEALWRALRGSDAVLVATGAVAGFASGLLGIGGGTVVTPLLTIATGLPQLSVLGTSLTAMVAPSLVGLAQHARLGNVDWRMAAALAAGTLAGGAAGGRVALEMPEGLLEWVFCFGMLFLARKTLAGAGAAQAAKAKAKAKAAEAGTGAAAATATAAAAAAAAQGVGAVAGGSTAATGAAGVAKAAAAAAAPKL